jgi:hypothetical protein
VKIRLECNCPDRAGRTFAQSTYRQLNDGHYSRGAAVLHIPVDPSDWLLEHRTARKRASHARNLGYRFAAIDREDHVDEICEINLSMPERQGRPMSDGYRARPSFSPIPANACPRHRVYPYGVTAGDGTLVAYMWLYRVGELAMVSSILGHGAHLANDPMYLLFAGALADQTPHGGACFSNLFDSGTDGLRYFKSRLGFAPRDVVWCAA